MKNEPLVAIAIPVYNGELYIRECLDHILAQTHQNWICCITDNASIDNTYEIVQEYAASDSRFRIFRNPETTTPWKNFNIAYSRLVDIDAKYAKAEPADDWMYPECIEKMVEVLEREIGQFSIVERDGLIIACAALYPIADSDAGELACLAVNPEYRHGGRGDELLERIEERARALGLKTLYVLTTRTAHWFQERGFEPSAVERLPAARASLYNYQRNSKIFEKAL